MGYKTPIFAQCDHWHTEWWSFRYLDRRDGTSFIHSAALVAPSGRIVARANCRYVNRTWESHSGDTVRERLADKLDGMMFAYGEDAMAQIASLHKALRVPADVPSCSSDRGTRVGYSLSMCCPM